MYVAYHGVWKSNPTLLFTLHRVPNCTIWLHKHRLNKPHRSYIYTHENVYMYAI